MAASLWSDARPAYLAWCARRVRQDVASECDETRLVTPCHARLVPYAGHTVEAMSCHTFALRLIFITLPPSIRLFVARVLHWTYLELFLCNRCYVLISLLYAEAMFV